MTNSLPKKKQNRFFASYIGKLLKVEHPKKGVTTNTKQQLNSVFCYLSNCLSADSKKMARISSKKTISESEILAVVCINFPRKIYLKVKKKFTAACDKSEKSDEKSVSRQEKAGVTFPPSITEKFLRDDSNMMITKKAPLALSCALEGLCEEIFDSAVVYSDLNKKIRLTIRDIELAVKNTAANEVFKKFSIKLLGGGYVPFIHPALTVKKPQKRKKKGDTSGPKTHRFKPGTVALRDIKKLQKVFNRVILAKSPFEKVIRALVKNKRHNVKISKQVFSILQYYLESYIVGILHRSNLAAVHAGRVKLLPEDIDFILALEDRSLPLNINIDDVKEDDEDPVDTKSITAPALQRLARQGGVKTMSNECVDVIRNLILMKAGFICDAILVVNNQGGTKTIMPSDIYSAIEYLGIRLAKAEKFGEPNAN